VLWWRTGSGYGSGWLASESRRLAKLLGRDVREIHSAYETFRFIARCGRSDAARLTSG